MSLDARRRLIGAPMPGGVGVCFYPLEIHIYFMLILLEVLKHVAQINIYKLQQHDYFIIVIMVNWLSVLIYITY